MIVRLLDSMKVIVTTSLTIIGGWIGWWLGDHIGIFTALVVSMIGTGVGMYAGRRFNQQFE